MNKLRLDFRLLENFSWPLIVAMLGLCACGLLNLYSVSSYDIFIDNWSWFTRQSIFMGLGFAGLVAVLLVDYQALKRVVWILYFGNVLTLVAVFFIGATVNGSTRWLDLGVLRFQPSETIKVITVITLAFWFSKRDLSLGLDFKDLVIPMMIVGFPFALIHAQPDLGTALHLLATCAPLFLVFKFRLRLLLSVGLSAILGAGIFISLLVSNGWSVLLEEGIIKPHQMDRIVNFFDPTGDPSGGGWQVLQSQNAVGGGQIFGWGFMEGSQHKNGFLPEAETDFAFAALAEEWGFVGSTLVVLLFFCLLGSALSLSQKSNDRFGSLVALGLTSLLFWQVIINMGMVMGLLPVVGIPLPFISYGGTSLIVSIVAVALILNVGMRRCMFQEEAIEENPMVWSQDFEGMAPVVVTVPVRRLNQDTPFEPELHPSYRLPHIRPWAKYLRKGRSRVNDWQTQGYGLED